jgi:multiple sugar transport system ATP-binding protein
LQSVFVLIPVGLADRFFCELRFGTACFMAAIRLDNLFKRYPNGQVAVRDVCLSVDDGEFLVLVGPSGCGKSSILRMVAGLEEVTGGDIFIGERRVNDLAPARRNLAMVFQNYALYPHMNVRENLAFGLRMQRTPREEIRRRVAEVAALLSIDAVLDRRPGELSGGQRQRVAVGRAIVRNPVAFLFDEPLSNLDARLRIQMRKELARLHQRIGTTAIYVTHDQVEAMTLGQRIAVMNDGQILQVAAPLELYESPASRFVAGFIGSPPMNLIDGRVIRVLSPPSVVFESAPLRYALSPAPGALIDGPCTLGFRPEHVTLDPADPPLGQATVDLVERLGSETVATFSMGRQTCVARLSGEVQLRPGDGISLHLPADRWHLFASDEPGSAIARGRDDRQV